MKSLSSEIWYLVVRSPCCLLRAGLLPGSLFDPEEWKLYIPPKLIFRFIGLCWITSQKSELFKLCFVLKSLHLYVWLQTVFGLVSGFNDHLYTRDPWLHFTDHWHRQTSVLSLLQSPLAVPWQRIWTQERSPRGPHRKHRSSIAVLVCCVRYLATTAVYRVTA
jgi:hypothetical protein